MSGKVTSRYKRKEVEHGKERFSAYCSASADWLILAGLIGVIYGTLPFGPKIIRSIYGITGRELFGSGVLILGVFGAIAALWYTFRFHRHITAGYVGRIVLVACILYYVSRFITVPAERVHFIEYGLVGIAIERVLRRYIRDAGRPFVAMLLAYFVGMGDETIQWLLSNRHGEIMDALLNGCGGVLGVLLLPWPKQSLTHSAHRLIFGMATIAIVLSVSFTFATRDFGYMIVDDSKGFRFRSRIAPENLIDYDFQNRTLFGGILSRDMSLPYRKFLKKYPADESSFLHEMRVHIFRRDRYADQEGMKAARIALKENQILETYFGQTLVEAGLAWPVERVRALYTRDANVTEPFYTSPVSDKVITGFSPLGFGIIGVGLLFLNGILFIFTSKKDFRYMNVVSCADRATENHLSVR